MEKRRTQNTRGTLIKIQSTVVVLVVCVHNVALGLLLSDGGVAFLDMAMLRSGDVERVIFGDLRVEIVCVAILKEVGRYKRSKTRLWWKSEVMLRWDG